MNWIADFVKCVFPLDTRESDVEAGFRLKYDNLPSSLFKYRACNPNSFLNLQEDTVWLADPTTFNDPYDCHHFINFENLANRMIMDMPAQLKARIPADKLPKIKDQLEKSDRPYDVLMDVMLDDVDPALRATMKTALQGALAAQFESMANAGERMKNGFKLCSFSERVDSSLMWAHYSGDHKGFCIEYDIRSVPAKEFTSRFMFPVIYRDNVFDATELISLVRTPKFNNIYLNQASLIKGNDWSYEKEWRLVFGNNYFDKPRAWKMPTPKAVYIGSHIKAEDEEKLKEICSKKGIPMFKMRHSRSHFLMTPESI